MQKTNPLIRTKLRLPFTRPGLVSRPRLQERIVEGLYFPLTLVIPLFLIYSILIFAFGLGVWLSADQKRVLHIAACLIIGKEILGVTATLFFPIHLRGVARTQSDTMHGILTIVGVLLCMFPAMGFGAAAFGKKLRLYSIGTMLIFLVFGTLAGFDQPGYAANLPTPWMGIYERINIYGYLLWIVVLAIARLCKHSDSLRLKDGKSNHLS